MLDKLSSKNITSGDRTASVIITELHMKIFYILGTGIHTYIGDVFWGKRFREFRVYLYDARGDFISAEDSCIFLSKGNLLYCTVYTMYRLYNVHASAIIQ